MFFLYTSGHCSRRHRQCPHRSSISHGASESSPQSCRHRRGRSRCCSRRRRRLSVASRRCMAPPHSLPISHHATPTTAFPVLFASAAVAATPHSLSPLLTRSTRSGTPAETPPQRFAPPSFGVSAISFLRSALSVVRLLAAHARWPLRTAQISDYLARVAASPAHHAPPLPLRCDGRFRVGHRRRLGPHGLAPAIGSMLDRSPYCPSSL